MRLTKHLRYVCLLMLITWIDDLVVAKTRYMCPIGFNLAFTQSEKAICYQLKGPEAFGDKFKDCIGNLYTSKLYYSLNLTRTNNVLWTEYKTLYPGGPFIDWSYTESAGDILTTTYDVKYDTALGIDEDFCVVIDPVSNFTATKCDEKHYRYCFVPPYPTDQDDVSKRGCTEFQGSWRFFSPSSSCLTPVTGVGGGTVRATWKQAYELCAKRGGSLLNKGWRYSNSPLLHSSGSYPMYPMGLVMNADHNILRYDAENDEELPDSKWHFETMMSPRDAVLGAIRDEFWYLVNSSYVFFDVICEKPAPIKHISLQISVDWENKIILTANDTIKKNDIHCFSDSLIYFPSSTNIGKSDDTEKMFRVDADHDGYYWCMQNDYKNYHVSESNRALYIRSRDSVQNLYACKIRLRKEHRFENMEKLNKVWKKKLEEFIYYSTKYRSVYGELIITDYYKTEKILKAFKNSKPDLNWKDTDVIYSLKIKRLYLDAKTALVHVLLNPEMKPVNPGIWDNLEVLSMKPAFFCKGFDSVPTIPLGESATSAGCRLYTCVGDFNEGVQWVESAASTCTSLSVEITESMQVEAPTLPSPFLNPGTLMALENEMNEMAYVESNNSSTEEELCSGNEEKSGISNSSEIANHPKPPPPNNTSNCSTPDSIEEPVSTTPVYSSTFEDTTLYTESTATLTPIPPQQQLDHVLEGLENLLQNDSVPFDSIADTFDQVNDILNLEEDELEIPGQLLHMLDELGARVHLGGQPTAVAVRNNIALLLADVTPENPVRGMRVAASEFDGFNNESFAFIDGEIGETSLQSNTSEAVVHLPASVTRTDRRVSFVAFRNQRAFPPAPSGYPLPSTVAPAPASSSSDISSRSSRSASVPVFVNSRVFSVKVENLTQFEEGEVIDIHLSPILEVPDRNQSRVCAFWQFTETGGYWSQDGCELIRRGPGILDTCRCTHLTHFAEILVARTVFSEKNERALEILSLIGCFMSMFGLVMIALTALLFRSWRRDYSNKIWLQLCVAIFILVLCFVVVAFTKFTHYDISCMLIGVALHYSVLASFCWMLVAAVLSYRRLVLVFTRDMSHKLLRASAFSWGAPCAVVGILLSIDPLSYAGQFEEMAPSGAFCYPSGLSLWLAVYAPVVAMLLANWTLFILIVRSVFASRRIQRHGDSNEALRCASVSCLLVFLFGLPWVFGLFASNIVAAYLFTVTVTFQGFVLFFFFVVGNKKTRDLWLNKLKIKQTRKIPVTSSTYTNRSTGWRGGVETPTSIEAKTSKPRSLTSPDESRFS